MNALNRTRHFILPFPQTCLPLVFPVLEDDATICTATNANNFPITFDSSLSLSPQPTRHFCPWNSPRVIPLSVFLPLRPLVSSLPVPCSKNLPPVTSHPFIPLVGCPPLSSPSRGIRYRLYQHFIFNLPGLLKAVPQPDQAARRPVCKHSESLGRREIVCKHRSWVFDCWGSLKTSLKSSHPKYKYGDYYILKPLLPLGAEKVTSVLHIWGEIREEGNEAARKKRKLFLPASWISQIP